MGKINDIEIDGDTKIKDLVNKMYRGCGFSSKKIKTGAEIFKKMYEDKECFTFLSFPACIIATGLRGIIKKLVQEKKVDCIITTCGTLDHDFARIWKDYYIGSFDMDDIELKNNNICRLGNVLVPNESYGDIIEEKLLPILEEIYKRNHELNTRELIWKIGEKIKNEENAKESIIYWLWKNKIPIYIPGITDGSFGFQLFMFWQDHKDFIVNLLKDEKELSDIVYTSKKTGALMIGGGISKHHVIWWNQFKGGLDYAIYITTAVEYDGSLSGARLREAISWGKIKENAKKITIEGDATTILPLLIGAT
ncbi:MAG: deoxyhypusine synthase [Candidatus Aenigmarchaeota archaeon ex4484_56]|nr:MAG: deoxyhypusine synthase [Candidatus Aenigmarchaeota archaeon ex4484_56]